MSVVIEVAPGERSHQGERAVRYSLRGALTFATAGTAHGAGLGMLNNIGAGASSDDGQSIVLDCGSVTDADSAGLALLLDWRREAMQRGITLRYANFPASIAQLARISGVESLLKIE